MGLARVEMPVKVVATSLAALDLASGNGLDTPILAADDGLAGLYRCQLKQSG
jgi:hypothetical protein